MDYECLGVNAAGHLTVDGVDTLDLAAEYGTPLYVFSEQTVRNACRAYKTAIDRYYGGKGMALYASKAFSCKEMYRIVASEGLGTDVVSGGELYTALQAGFDPQKILFHGNNKTPDELRFALESGVGRIVVDHFSELEILEALATELHTQAHVLLRIKPGIDAHTHDFIKTGQIDCKFGFTLENGEAMQAVKAALELKNVRLTGIHAHIGSQIFEIEPFCLCAQVLLQFMAEVRSTTGNTLSELNLGGGFGIRYTAEDTPRPFGDFIAQVAATVGQYCTENDFPTPYIYMEPGRSIVAPAGITLYKVGVVKEIPGVRTYVSVDGGMGDNPRYALYGAKYDMLLANKAAAPKDFVATVAGKCCESGDLLGENIALQTPEEGDTLAVLATGAYHYSMASNYNRIPRPATVMVGGGKSRLIIKRETYADLVQNDL